MSDPLPEQQPSSTGPLGSASAQPQDSAPPEVAGPVWPPEETEPDAGHGRRGILGRLRSRRR